MKVHIRPGSWQLAQKDLANKSFPPAKFAFYELARRLSQQSKAKARGASSLTTMSQRSDKALLQLSARQPATLASTERTETKASIKGKAEDGLCCANQAIPIVLASKNCGYKEPSARGEVYESSLSLKRKDCLLIADGEKFSFAKKNDSC